MGRPKGSGNMELWKHGKPNPNMNIGNERKTGPKTEEGKIAITFNVNKWLTPNSKYVKMMSKCGTCPLRPKEKQRYDPREKKMVLTYDPPKCTFYMSKETEVNGVVGEKCVFPPDLQIAKLKTVFHIIGNKKPDEILSYLVAQAQSDAEMSRTSARGRMPTPRS